MSSVALYKAGLGDAWKCHAWACAIQTLKHVPTTTDRGLMSPYEYKNGHAADLSRSCVLSVAVHGFIYPKRNE